MNLRNLCPFILVLWAASSLLAQGPQFTIQDLGTLPNLPYCSATALSQGGNVAGYCLAEANQELALDAPVTHVFLYSKGAMTDLGIASPKTSVPSGVNDSGAVVGGSIVVNVIADTASTAPFFYLNGSIQPPPSSLGNALPLALNNAGQAVGTSFQVNSSLADFFIDSSAFLYSLSTGAITQLEAPTTGGAVAAYGINSGTMIAGATVGTNATDITPLLWTVSSSGITSQSVPLLSGYNQGLLASVNDSGVATGIAFNLNLTVLVDPNAAAHAVLYQNSSTVTDLGVLSGDISSFATSINNSGTVVGFSSTQRPDFALSLAGFIDAPSTSYHAFIYSGGKMYNLTNQLVNGTGWQLSFATAINNAGQIIGTGLFTGAGGTAVQHAFLLTPATGPFITGVVGAAFSTPAVTSISPNGIFTIFGNNLTTGAPVPLSANDIIDGQLPTDLGGTCVESGSTKLGLFYVSSGQINALAGPFPNSNTLPATVPITVVTDCDSTTPTSSASVNVNVAPVAPEFLYFVQNTNGDNPVAAIEQSGAYVGQPGLISGATFTPAKTGDVLTAFGVGWGATTSSASIGTLATAAATLTNSYSLTLGGMPVQVSYAGLTPGFAGLYQINFTVPSGLTAGNQPLVLTVDGVQTEAMAYIAVGN